jgi:3-oxoacyl-[acyl-carrier protein] reductase
MANLLFSFLVGVESRYMKKALITGVSKGIGRTIAKTLHSEGFHIFGVYKWSDSYKDEKPLAEKLSSQLPNLTLIPCDLNDRKSYQKIAKVIGNTKLDAVVHNAGEFLENSWKKFNIENWDRSIAVNMEAPLLLTKQIENNLNNNIGIVIISSTDAWFSAFDDLGYGVSKAGLNNVVKSLAAALANRKIRVNAILPGWVDTDMAESANVNELAQDKTLLGRNATPQEIANVVSFLLSDKASFMTGSLVPVDGGYTAVDYVVKKEHENR